MKQRPTAIMFVFACGTNNRYSMAWWEEAFCQVGERVVGDLSRVHFGYANLNGGKPDVLAGKIVHFDATSEDPEHLRAVAEYVRREGIEFVFGFDFPVRRKAYAVLRAAGVKVITAYWGAPISGPYRGWRLLLRRAEVAWSAPSQPDLYVFQADAMARTATEGRGISRERVAVCRSGVDEDRYSPPPALTSYAHDVFGIPRDRKIALYAGHLSERKGLSVIMRAARDLTDARDRRDIHFLLLGEEAAAAEFRPLLSGSRAEEYVTFGGYRSDMPDILRSTYVGLRPTTGWDSFPVSCMEMSSAGVPLITSDMGGLPEMVDEGKTGRVLPAGDHVALAEALASLANDPAMRERWSVASRERILGGYTRVQFLHRLSDLLDSTWGAAGDS